MNALTARIAKLERANRPDQTALTVAEIDAAVARYASELEWIDPAKLDWRPIGDLVANYRDMLRNAKGWEAKVYANCTHADFML